jgi:tetratricopeptide (TPR) repeat protein
MENIFALQEDIAQKIASALKVKISPEEKSLIGRVPTKNTKALDTYNEALNSYVGLVYSFHSTYTEELSSKSQIYIDYKKTLDQCDQVIELDSTMAEAYVLKAKAYNYINNNFKIPTNFSDTIALLCRKALSLNENATDAYVLLSGYFFDKGDEESGIKNLNKAFAIDPNNFEVNWTLGKYYSSKDPVEAIRYFKKALRLDPLSVWTPMVYDDFSWVYSNICDFEKNEYYLKKQFKFLIIHRLRPAHYSIYQ